MGKDSKDQLTRRVVKAMSVFGGVQIVNILCSIVRTKLVSIWIGAVGVGLLGIYNSVVEMIGNIAMMGINTSGTRDVARSHDDVHRVATVIIVRRWCRVLGILGAVATFLLAPRLSQWSFDDDNHVWSFRFLSVAIYLMCFMQGEMAILQGLSRFKNVARASLTGALGGLLVSIPLFYYLRQESFVWVIIVTWFFLALGVLLNRGQMLKLRKLPSLRETIKGGGSLIQLGAFITISGVVMNIASYLLMAYLNTHFDTRLAGYYQSGFTVISRYVGLVFTAITMEFLPRMAGVIHRNNATQVYISHEMKLALCVLVPVVGLLIVFAPVAVEILYSSDFMAMVPMVEIGIIGTVFRAMSWCMAICILVRGDGVTFLVVEVLSATAYLLLNILTVNIGGVAAMGWAYVGWYFFYAILVAYVYFFKYRLRLNPGVVKLMIYSILMLSGVYVVAMYVNRWVGLVPVVLSATVSMWVMMMRKKSSTGITLKNLIKKQGK